MQKVEQKTAQAAAYSGVIPNTPFRFIWHISKPQKWWAFGALVAVTIGQIGGSAVPIVVGKLTDGITLAVTTEEQLSAIEFWGTSFLILMFLLYAGWRLSEAFGMVWQSRSNAYAYNQLYGYIAKHSHTFFSNRFAGSLSNKVSNAADDGIRLLDRLLWGAYPQVIATIISGILLWTISPLLGIGFIVFMTVLAIANFYMVKIRRPYVVTYALSSSKLRGEGVDFLTNIAASRQYVQLPYEAKRLSTTVEDRRKKEMKQWSIGELILVVNNVAAVVLSAVVVISMFYLLKNNMVTSGQVVLAFLVLFQIGRIFVRMGEIMNNLIRIYGVIEEGLKEVLLPHEILDAKDAKPLQISDSHIEWKSVNFEFGENAVFKDFNLDIKPGQRVGLVGPSGAGKTTFVSLLLRQHDLDSGGIEIDGQNIAAVTQDSLRKNIAVVPQEPLLFHRTIRENIAYGKEEATNEEIIAVAIKAQAHDFIKDLSHGYDTLVGERGIKLSGGQKQRVAIARAMLKDAPILVLDEATSALDSESEVLIQKALQKLMEGKTVVAIAHRLSTLREMDRILVMENGQIQEDGTHDELSQGSGTYARLWKHQAGGFLQE